MTDQTSSQHPDDAAVDALAALMKAKLAKQRAKGYGGWDDKTQCSQQRLSDMLRAHVDKGDPVDVANFCAFLLARGEVIAAALQPMPVVQQLKANCYSDDNGDYWRDCPDDCDFVDGLKVGDTYELQASIRAWSETFRVTKAPDETSDDYEVELVSSDAPKNPAYVALASVVAGAVFDFAGYLTTLPEDKAIHASEVHEASPMVDAITAWAAKRNLETADANVEGWRAAVTSIDPEAKSAGTESNPTQPT